MHPEPTLLRAGVPLGLIGVLAIACILAALWHWRRRVRDTNRALQQVHAELRDSQASFRELFLNHNAINLIVDPASGSIIEANHAAARFYGYTRKQLRRMRIQDINTHSEAEIQSAMQQADAGARVHFEFRHRLADNSLRDVAVFSGPIRVRGRLLLHSIIHDVTTEKELERELVQAQKLETIGRLASGVAHDYTNILGVIMGYAELALHENQQEEIGEYLREITLAAERSACITRRLLAFARNDSAQQPQVLDLNKAIHGLLNMLRRLIGEEVEIRFEPAPELWPVRVDPIQFDQVLINLCVNARDAIKGFGTITLQTSCITAEQKQDSDLPEGEWVEIAVKDTGCGMDKTTAGRAFDPFYTTKEAGKGTGIGLSTVRNVMESHGGRIDLHSHPGQGSCFRLTFPRALDNELVAREQEPRIPHGKGECILVLDSLAASQRMIADMLMRLEYCPLLASTPEEALQYTTRHDTPHLLICDTAMEGIDMAALLHEMQLRVPGLGVLFISGHGKDYVKRAGLCAEGRNYLHKPFSYPQLALRLRQLLDTGEKHTSL